MKRTLKAITFILGLCAAIIASAETFSGTTLVRPRWVHTKTAATTATETFGNLYEWTFTSGHTTNQMDQLWTDQRTLTNAATETLDLAGGITNTFGTVLTMAEVRLIAVGSASANTDTIILGNAASNEFDSWLGGTNQTLIVRPGGFFFLAAPDVTAYTVSTNGNLKISNGGTNSVTYDIYIGGASQ